MENSINNNNYFIIWVENVKLDLINDSEALIWIKRFWTHQSQTHLELKPSLLCQSNWILGICSTQMKSKCRLVKVPTTFQQIRSINPILMTIIAKWIQLQWQFASKNEIGMWLISRSLKFWYIKKLDSVHSP